MSAPKSLRQTIFESAVEASEAVSAAATARMPFALTIQSPGNGLLAALRAGLTAFTPTLGLLELPSVRLSSSLDGVCIIAPGARECAAVLHAMHPTTLTPSGTDLHDWRIGLMADQSEDTDAVAEIFRGLGASIETNHWPFSTAILHNIERVIYATECLAIHQHVLASHPENFDTAFLSRTLPACLFQASEYISAQRERRRFIAAMQPLHRRFDVLVTIGFPQYLVRDSPASYWSRAAQSAAAPNPFGGPIVAMRSDLNAYGLPLGIQVLGRPFDEQAVLKVAQAYQLATRNETAPARYESSAPARAVAEPGELPDARLCSIVDALAERAGLCLTESLRTLLYAEAPLALACAAAIPRDHTWWEAPAPVFRANAPKSHWDSLPLT